MAKKVVGLIGNGNGPVIHVEGNCIAVIEGLKEGGVVTLSIDGKESIVFEQNGIKELGRKISRVFFSAEHASRELVCRILMEV